MYLEKWPSFLTAYLAVLFVDCIVRYNIAITGENNG